MSDDVDELFFNRPGGGMPTRLHEGPVGAFAFAADGSIVFVETADTQRLLAVPFAGGPETVLAGPLAPGETINRFEFSPDGETIVFRVGEALWATSLRPDPDGDGVLTLCDRCPGIADPEQVDDDDDGAGAACDCDDADAAVLPGAVEVNDGIDNQCPGDPGFGLVDETGADSGLPDDRNTYRWSSQPGAVLYEVVRSTAPDFSTDCVSAVVDTTSWTDVAVPAPGAVFHYLNRSSSPFPGSWGRDSSGTERDVICP